MTRELQGQQTQAAMRQCKGSVPSAHINASGPAHMRGHKNTQGFSQQRRSAETTAAGHTRGDRDKHLTLWDTK